MKFNFAGVRVHFPRSDRSGLGDFASIRPLKIQPSSRVAGVRWGGAVGREGEFHAQESVFGERGGDAAFENFGDAGAESQSDACVQVLAMSGGICAPEAIQHLIKICPGQSGIGVFDSKDELAIFPFCFDAKGASFGGITHCVVEKVADDEFNKAFRSADTGNVWCDLPFELEFFFFGTVKVRFPGSPQQRAEVEVGQLKLSGRCAWFGRLQTRQQQQILDRTLQAGFDFEDFHKNAFIFLWAAVSGKGDLQLRAHAR